MASLMENLISALQQECDAYEGLLELSRRKTPVIITGNLEELSKITDEEQTFASRIQNLDRKRADYTADIANVLNKDVATLKLKVLVELLKDRPSEQKALMEVHDRLGRLVKQLRQVNEQNGELLKESLEMIQIEMNLLQAMKAAPETANYTRGGYGSGDTMGVSKGGFDAKQ